MGIPYIEGNWQEEIAIPSGEPGPAIGEECFVAFEIRKPDAQGVPRPHDLPFEALGKIGCWKDHDLARGLAFRVEWEQPDGSFTTRYIQRTWNKYGVRRDFFEANMQGALRAYINAIGIRNYLLQVETGCD